MSQERCLYEVAGLRYCEKLTLTQLSQFSSADSTGCVAVRKGKQAYAPADPAPQQQPEQGHARVSLD